MFVLDVADDLLQHVLDGDDAGDVAVLVDHHRHVVVRLAELLQQVVQALALRHEDGRAGVVLDVEAVFLVEQQRQHVLGVQNAAHVVHVARHHGKARVPGFDDRRHEVGDAAVHVHSDHLRARHHDVPGAHVGHRQGAVDDVQRVLAEQLPLAGVFEHLQNGAGVGRFDRQQLRQPVAPALAPFARRRIGDAVRSCAVDLGRFVHASTSA